MLLTVLILSGTILSATTIAGLLMLYQIRQSADIASSNKAIYAADSGLEQALYNLIKNDQCEPEIVGVFNNGAAFKASCQQTEYTPPPNCTTAGSETVLIQSRGEARKNYRAFSTELSRVIPPPPCPPPPSP